MKTSMHDVEPQPSARPFLKWAGGKRRLLPAILTRLPRACSGNYHEPFLGGASVFFELAPQRAVLSDLNERLMRTYAGLQRDVEAVIRLLSQYANQRDFFHTMRTMDVDRKPDVDVAAWFIYLNRTCYNGLYRVNRQNRFNVPFGSNSRALVCDAENLRACARALRHVELRVADFADVRERARAGDIVYFDPPYVPLSPTSRFAAYTAAGFTAVDQVRLRDVALELRAAGVRVLVSNSSTPLVEKLYGGLFDSTTVWARRAISSTGAGRAAVRELLLN